MSPQDGKASAIPAYSPIGSADTAASASTAGSGVHRHPEPSAPSARAFLALLAEFKQPND
jgi:hypothetical protein